MRPFICDTTHFLLDAAESDKNILFEGAQGSLLDVDHGTFPFVTSSNSSGVGVPSGSGVPGSFMQRIVGVVKAYTTRVGGGPFPSEQDNEQGQHLRERGNEYGTVTGRPRRCGWFDAVAANYTSRVSGISELAVMLLDVLSDLKELKICTAYEIGGQQTHVFSRVMSMIFVTQNQFLRPSRDGKPTFKHVKQLEDLPPNARNYLEFIGMCLRRPITYVSVGPERSQTIQCRLEPANCEFT